MATVLLQKCPTGCMPRPSCKCLAGKTSTHQIWVVHSPNFTRAYCVARLVRFTGILARRHKAAMCAFKLMVLTTLLQHIPLLLTPACRAETATASPASSISKLLSGKIEQVRIGCAAGSSVRVVLLCPAAEDMCSSHLLML